MTKVNTAFYDFEAEELVIATALSYPETAEELVALEQHHFANPKNRRQHQVIKELYREHGEIDPLLFSEKAGLKQSELMELTGKAFSETMMEYSIKKLKDISRRRSINEAVDKIKNQLSNPGIEVDHLVAETARFLDDTLTEATQAPHIKLIDAVERRIDNYLHGEHTPGVGTGLADLDYYWSGFYPGELTILAARPSMGKTALAQALSAKVAVRTKKPVLIFSLEMATDYLADRYIATELEVSADDLRRGVVPQKYVDSNYSKTLEKFAKMKLYIQDQANITTHEIAAQARKLKKQEGDLGLIVVDYLTLISDTGEVGETNHQKIFNMTKRLRAIAKNLQVPVMTLAQLSREVEKRSDKRPVLSDLRESGGIEEVADNVLFIYRDNYYHPEADNTTEIIVAKQRQGPRGVIAKVFYDPACGRFENITSRATA